MSDIAPNYPAAPDDEQPARSIEEQQADSIRDLEETLAGVRQENQRLRARVASLETELGMGGKTL